MRLLAGLFALFALAALPSSVAAKVGEFTINTCGKDTARDRWKPLLLSSSNWRIYPSCPGVIELDSGNAVSGNGRWMYQSPKGLRIKSVSARVSGSDGSDGSKRYGIQICSSTVCGDQITTKPNFSSGSGAVNQTYDLGSLQIPEGAEKVQLFGECLIDICPASQRFTIEYLAVTFIDDVPPPSPHISNSSFVANQWHTGVKSVKWSASDVGSGVMAFEVTGQDWYKSYSISNWRSCYPGMTATDFCRTSDFGDAYWDFRLGALYDGPGFMHFRTIDMAQNRSEPITIPIKIDRVAPAAPNSVRVSNANAAGWINEPDFDLEWVNGGESVETEKASGIGSAGYRVDPPGSPLGGINYPANVAVEVTELPDKPLPADGDWQVTMGVSDRAGNRSPLVSAPVRRDTTLLDAPSVTSDALIGIADQTSESAITWQRPANVGVSGICGYSMQIDRSPDTNPGESFDIEGDVERTALPSAVEEGAAYAHLRAVTCASKGGVVQHVPIEIDLTRPRASVRPSGGWSTQTEPVLISGTDGGTGVDQLKYVVDGAQEVTVPADASALDLPDGKHTISVVARDRAGNESTREIASFGLDRNPPTAAISEFDAADPTRVEATVQDSGSGIRRASLEYKPVSGGDWTALDQATGAEGSVEPTALAGYLPDDRLKPGKYVLRVSARDHAGHGVDQFVRAGGTAAQLDLPLRATTKLIGGIEVTHPTRCPAKSKRRRGCTLRSLVAARTVPFGSRVAVAGRLADAKDGALAGHNVEILSRDAFTNKTDSVGIVKTGADGGFRFVAPPGVNREFTIAFRGTKRLLPSKFTTRLFVRSRITLRTNRRTARIGQRVVFSGRLDTGGTKVPPFGKLIVLKFHDGRSWKPSTIELPNIQSDGRFRHEWTVPPFSRSLRMSLRVETLEESPWPFTKGWSKPIRLTIRR